MDLSKSKTVRFILNLFGMELRVSKENYIQNGKNDEAKYITSINDFIKKKTTLL